ncbi:uncharacterized protein METZ01_LOCUS328333, partial [marine metagenome]
RCNAVPGKNDCGPLQDRFAPAQRECRSV